MPRCGVGAITSLAGHFAAAAVWADLDLHPGGLGGVSRSAYCPTTRLHLFVARMLSGHGLPYLPFTILKVSHLTGEMYVGTPTGRTEGYQMASLTCMQGTVCCEARASDHGFVRNKRGCLAVVFFHHETAAGIPICIPSPPGGPSSLRRL